MDMSLRDCILGLQTEANKITSANKVRRCLFGRPDHNELKNELKSQLHNTNSYIRFIEAWNFDPQQDQPCQQGRFHWTLVNDDEYIPSFYRKSYERTKFTSECNSKAIVSRSQVPDVLSRLSDADLLNTDSEAKVVGLHRENETTPKVRTLRTRIDACQASAGQADAFQSSAMRDICRSGGVTHLLNMDCVRISFGDTYVCVMSSGSPVLYKTIYITESLQPWTETDSLVGLTIP